MAMVMGYVEADDHKLLKELTAEDFQVVEVRVNPLSRAKVLLAKDFESDVEAKNAADSRSQMRAVPGGSIELLKPDSVRYSLTTTDWGGTLVSGDDFKNFDADERRAYLETLNKMRRVLVGHAKAWIVLAAVGTAALLVMLFLTFNLVSQLLTDTSKTTATNNIATKKANFDGWEVSLIIFTLAIFVASPAVLLILGRPLAGIDTWMPGAKPEKPNATGNAADDAKGDNKT